MTKEEALIELKRDIHNAKVTHHLSEHYEIAIKALEQENTLDKIVAEIENHCGLLKENHCRYCSYCNSVMGIREILEVIDNYKADKE